MSKSEQIKVGDLLWFDCGFRIGSDRWSNRKITKETPRSWIVEGRSGRDVPVSKKDLTAAPEEPAFSKQRRQYFTTASKDRHVMESEWRRKWARKVAAQVEHGTIELQKKVLALLRAEGIDVKPD